MIVKKFFIFNTAEQRIMFNAGTGTLEEATEDCKKLNDAMKPQFATYMVVEIQDAYQQ